MKNAFIIVCVFLSATSFAQNSLHNAVDSLFSSFNSNTPGYAIAIIKDGKIEYEKGYGMSNLESGAPITPSTIFHLASVSKQFTSFCIYLLAEKAKLNLDDPVQKYLPDLPHYLYPVTIRNLLQHTSGIRDQWELLGLSGTSEPDQITQQNVLDIIYRQKELNFKPGDKWMYSNSGYSLLAEIVEKVSGERFPDYIQKHVFQPLGMKNSFINDNPQKIILSKASSYEAANEKNKYLKKELNYSNYGATDMNSTVHDLSFWIMEFEKIAGENKTILGKMQQRGILNNGDSIQYGSGLFIDKYKGLQRIFHDGNDAGFQTFLGYFPEKDLGIIVLSNLLSENPTGKAMRIADIYLQLPTVRTVRTDKLQFQYQKTNRAYLPLYAGNFETPGGNLIRIIPRDTGLQIQFPDMDVPESLKAINDTVFRVFDNMQITFRNREKSGFQQIGFKTNTFSNTANKVIYAQYDLARLKDFTGIYYSEEVQTVYEVKIKNDHLILYHVRNGEIELAAKTQDRFATNKWYADKIIFQRNKNNEVISFLASSGRMKNVLFKKTKF
jgi:CubicO group peptidase (beta-lactamase class C family)